MQVPSDRYQGIAAAKLMYQDGARHAGLVYEDSTYGYGLAFNFIAAFTNGKFCTFAGQLVMLYAAVVCLPTSGSTSLQTVTSCSMIHLNLSQSKLNLIRCISRPNTRWASAVDIVHATAAYLQLEVLYQQSISFPKAHLVTQKLQ